MKLGRWLGACLVLVALSMVISVQGQEKGGKKTDPKQAGKEKGKEKGTEKGTEKGSGTKLEWKGFEKGKKFYQEMTTTTHQTMKVLTMTVVQQQTQTFYVEWSTEDVGATSYTVKQKIIGVKMHIEIGGNKIEYDSTVTGKEKDQTNPLTDFFKALVNQEFTLTINKSDLKVTNVKGREEFIAALSKANPQLKPLLDAILSKEALEQMADPVFAAIPPGGEIPKGNKWEKKSVLEMGPIGKYTTLYKFDYKDSKGGIAEIGVKTDLKYDPPTGKDSKEGLPFRIVDATLKSKEGAGGAIKFSVEKGRIASSDMEMTLEGDLSIEIAGQTTKVNLLQKQKSSLVTKDEPPSWHKTK